MIADRRLIVPAHGHGRHVLTVEFDHPATAGRSPQAAHVFPPDDVRAMHAAEQILQHCIDVGGTLTGEHGVGVEKLHLMPYLFDESTMRQFERVKHAFDPGDRVNAGKLIPSEKVVVTLLKPGRQSPQ